MKFNNKNKKKNKLVLKIIKWFKIRNNKYNY